MEAATIAWETIRTRQQAKTDWEFTTAMARLKVRQPLFAVSA